MFEIIHCTYSCNNRTFWRKEFRHLPHITGAKLGFVLCVDRVLELTAEENQGRLYHLMPMYVFYRLICTWGDILTFSLLSLIVNITVVNTTALQLQDKQ